MTLETALLLSLAVVPITPYGTRLAAYPFTVASTLPLNVGNILEWQSMPFNIAGGKLFLVIVLGFFLAQMMAPFTLRLSEVVLLLFGRGSSWRASMCGFCCYLCRSARPFWR